jgi:hypothetical protein
VAGSLPQPPLQLSGAFDSGNFARGSIAGGSGPGNPPGSNGPKRRFSADLQDLFNEFSRRSLQTPSPALKTALNFIVKTAGVMREREPRDPIVSDLLRKSASLLHRATAEEVSLLPPQERIMVAAALFSVGEMILMNRQEDRECVTTLFQATSDFCRHVDHDPSPSSGELLFLQDRYLSCMLTSLMGWLKKDGLTEEQGEPLAALLGRIAILSGSFKWPTAGYDFPNVTGAVCLFYEGIDPAIVPEVDLLPPSSYFGSAMKWRPKPLGQIDYILSTLLDRSTRAAAILIKSLAEQVPYPVISQMHREISQSLGAEEENQRLLWSTLVEQSVEAAAVSLNGLTQQTSRTVISIMPPEVDHSLEEESVNQPLLENLVRMTLPPFSIPGEIAWKIDLPTFLRIALSKPE